MSDDLKLPEEWAEELGHVSKAPRDGRRVFSPAYRAADGLHHWNADAYHAPPDGRLRISRQVFEAALEAPRSMPQGMREPMPVAAAVSPYAPAAVKKLAAKGATTEDTTTEDSKEIG